MGDIRVERVLSHSHPSGTLSFHTENRGLRYVDRLVLDRVVTLQSLLKNLLHHGSVKNCLIVLIRSSPPSIPVTSVLIVFVVIPASKTCGHSVGPVRL